VGPRQAIVNIETTVTSLFVVVAPADRPRAGGPDLLGA
jgi:hypothetical protein